MAAGVTYDDGLVRVDAEGVLVRHYYFPLGRARQILWAELDGFSLEPLTLRSGRYRGWGSHRPDRWFPLDVRRRHKARSVVLDAGRVSPVVTPDDVDGFVDALRSWRTPPIAGENRPG